MRDQLALVLASTRRRSNSCGRQVHASPSTVTTALARSTRVRRSRSLARPPGSARRSAARSRASSSSIAERLGDVVVGAGVERGDLLPLVPDCREHDHRRRAPRAQLPATSVPTPSGSTRSRITARAAASPPRQARPRRCPPSRPRSRRLAGSSAAPAGSAARRPRPARATRSRVAYRGLRSGVPARTWRPDRRGTRPRRGRRWPRRSRGRSPGRARRRAAGGGAAALERLEQAVEFLRRNAGAVVDHPHVHLGWRPLTCNLTGSSCGEYLSAFSIRLAERVRSGRRPRACRAPGPQRHLHPVGVVHVRDRLPHQVVDRPAPGRAAPHLTQPGEVEQVGDDPVKPCRLDQNRPRAARADPRPRAPDLRGRAPRRRSGSPSGVSAGRG